MQQNRNHQNASKCSIPKRKTHQYRELIRPLWDSGLLPPGFRELWTHCFDATVKGRALQSFLRNTKKGDIVEIRKDEGLDINTFRMFRQLSVVGRSDGRY